ncbi:hypothetical protein Ddye_029188 [Dipteronia dyeriana]|uniref:BRCT domain-containing protein n=1 Tax=Dipteronia dyeriana TaxID=168575 RepID=A0AAD9WKE7_9ROSI|nr:hypothetical protein Ddye_029188 [Dipteronia dyeriana]
MASLGFRHPQFSEDLPWLPAWLQRHQVEVSEESQVTTSQSLKDLAILQGSISEGKEVDLLSREEGRYSGCHLFLSGQDNSLTSFAPSSENVLHLHLHLSSYGDSQHSQSEPFLEPQIQRDCNKLLSGQQVETSVGAGGKNDDNVVCSGQQDETSASYVNKTNINNVLPMQHAETSAGTENKSYQLKTDNNAGDGNSLPPTSIQKVSESLGIQSPVLKQDSERQSERNSNVRYLQVADVSDAVELSISASEALVIHELVKSESASEALPAAAVIEAALRVKQARLERLEDTFHYPSEAFKEIDEIDILSDLDDWDIADACEDVGFSFIDPDNKLSCGSYASQVKFIPSAENHYGCDNEFKHIDVQAQQEKHPVDSALAFNSSLLASHIDPVLQVLAVAQPEDGMDAFLSRDSDNAARKDITSYSVADRFRSRWFGGWTGVKEVEAPPELEQNNSKSIPKFYVNETSFFSESADIAPSENSFVQKRETGSKITSQSSVRFEGSYKKADEGILTSQDVSSSILSSVDPLCSVVPCSISSMNTNSQLAEEHNDIEVNADKQPLEVEDWLRTTDLNVESFHWDRNHAPTFDGKSSETPVRRQLTLLKNYSTLFPKHDSNLERGRLYHNQSFLSEYDAELLPLEQNMSRSLLFRSASNCAVGTGNEEACNTALIRRETEETENHNKSHGAELQFQTLKESRSPRILNRRTHCCLHSSELLGDNVIGKKDPREAAEQETVTKLHQRNNSQNVLSECYNVLDTQAPARKQVHFMEVEVELQQNEDIQKPRSSHEIHSSKKSKYSNAWLHSRTQDIKRHLTTRAKHGKKLIFQGIEFLLTGFSGLKEKEIDGLIRKYGGMVLSGIPPPNSRRKRSAKSNFQQPPVILCPKKLKTLQFLYGCAVNSFILKVTWLTDSIAAGSVIPPEKYTILPNQADAEIPGIGKLVFHDKNECIFGRVGIMLLGSHSFSTKFTLIFMHGGGIVFKTLHWLVQSLETEKISVAAIVAEDERRVSRHLRHCASERKIPMMTASWITKSLHLGKLLPFKENKRIPLPTVKVPEIPLEWSEQI